MGLTSLLPRSQGIEHSGSLVRRKNSPEVHCIRFWPGGKHMNVWRWAGALVMVGAAIVGVTAYGQQPADKPVFKGFDEVNKSFWQEMTTETNQTMTVQGQQVKQDQKQTFWVKWT